MELIITSREELLSVVTSAISDFVQINAPKPISKAWLNMDEALDLINSNGIKLKKSSMYVKVSKGEIPHHKSGQSTVFNEEELLEWISAMPKRRRNDLNGSDAVAKSARRRLLLKN